MQHIQYVVEKAQNLKVSTGNAELLEYHQFSFISLSIAIAVSTQHYINCSPTLLYIGYVMLYYVMLYIGYVMLYIGYVIYRLCYVIYRLCYVIYRLCYVIYRLC